MIPTVAQFTFRAFLLSIGIFQGFLIAFLIFINSGKRQPGHRFLGLFILLFSLINVEDLLFETRVILKAPFLVDTFSQLLFALAPTLYLYVESMTSERFRLRWKHALHYLPFALLFSLTTLDKLISSPVDRQVLISNYQQGYYYFNPAVLLPISQVFIYLIAIIRLLLRHTENLKKSHSFLKGVNLRWIFVLVALNLTMWLIWAIIYAIRWTNGENLIDSVFIVMIFATGYFGLRQRDIFPDNDSAPAPADTGENIKPEGKYLKAGLDAERKKDIIDRLLNHMQARKAYLDPELTLPALSEQLDVSVNHLSQIINGELNTNFYNYVNSFRIEEVKKALADPGKDNLTILALAFDSGFNSKSTFNSVFKKIVGCSPQNFKRKLARKNPAVSAPSIR